MIVSKPDLEPICVDNATKMYRADRATASGGMSHPASEDHHVLASAQSGLTET